MKRSQPSVRPVKALAGLMLAALFLFSLTLAGLAGGAWAKTKTAATPQDGELGTPQAPKFNPQALLAPTATGGGLKEQADFNECVRVALAQSPILVKTALEIETKRLDTQDAWATFIPTISVNSTYWFSQPKNTDGSTNNPFTVSFSTGEWNPLISGFEVKAKMELTNIAVLAHLKVIGEGIRRLATDFLELSTAQDQKDLNKQKQDIAKQNLEYFKTRQGLGQATQLDLRIAETRLMMAKAEEDKINAQRAMTMDDIKYLIGIPFANKIDLNVRAAKEQVLGNFSLADIADDKIRAYSFDLRMLEYEKRLQRKNIALSYVKMLPSFGFTFQTINSLSSTQQQVNKGVLFYPGVNINMPLDFWTKGRDVARNYKKLDQLNGQEHAKEFDVMAMVQKTLSEYTGANSDYNVMNAQAELAQLQAEQSEYRYKTGQLDFDKYAVDKITYYDDAQKAAVEKLKRDIFMVTLKYLNGDLEKKFINVSDWEK